MKQSQSKPSIRGYYASKCDRAIAVGQPTHGSVGGGLLSYIAKKRTAITHYSVLNSQGVKGAKTGFQTVSMKFGAHDIALVNLYRNNPSVGVDYQRHLDDIAQSYEHVIVAGDLNAPSKAQRYHLDGHRVTEDGKLYDEWISTSAYKTSEFYLCRSFSSYSTRHSKKLRESGSAPFWYPSKSPRKAITTPPAIAQ